MNRAATFALLLLLAAFGAGVVWLLHARFARGDIYPPGSSLRADPLGTRALHDALTRFGEVRRHLRPMSELGDGRAATLLRLGATPADFEFSEREFNHLERFVSEGGRWVIALRADGGSRWQRLLRELDESAERPAPALTNTPGTRRAQPRREPTSPDQANPIAVKLEERWGFRAHLPPVTREAPELKAFQVRRAVEAELPFRLSWYSPAHLEANHPAWRVLYATSGDLPVAIERRVGRGTVVVLTDTWHFTNEALRDDRQPVWLAWLAGTGRRVLFDETHLGIMEEPGVATLLRRYRLYGVVAVLLALAGLFIWRNSTSFPPAEPAAPANAVESGAVRGREAAAGFVSLLRRNLPVSSLASTCYTEWRRSCARSTPPARLQAVEAAFAAEEAHSTTGRTVTALYRQLAQLLRCSDSTS